MYSKIMTDSKNLNTNETWKFYLQGRGISEATANKIARLGSKNQMVIPITNGTEVVGIKYRTLDKKISCEKNSSTNYLYNWQCVKKDSGTLIIVEGEIDLMSAIEVGFENVVSLPFGANNLACIDMQHSWINSFSKIIIATDSDDAGVKAKFDIIKRLGFVGNKFFEVSYESQGQSQEIKGEKGEPLSTPYDEKNRRVEGNSVPFSVNLENFEQSFKKNKDFNDVLMKSGKEVLKKIIENATEIEYEKNLGECEFKEKDGVYWIFEKNGFEQLTDFVIKVEKMNHNYIVGERVTDGRSQKFTCLRTELLCKLGILKYFGLYLGSDRTIPDFLNWIRMENREKYADEIEHYGIINEKYFDENSNVICGKNDLLFKNQNEIEELTTEDRAWLQENLLGIRKDKMQSLIGISWAVGRFHQSDDEYPILEVCGTTAIGKTGFVKAISKIMFGHQENMKSYQNLTNHQIRSLASCSNITPLCIDEIKIVVTKKPTGPVVDLYSILRCAYDNKTLNQGTVTDKLKDFKLCTPIIISGESELSEVSLKNRIVPVKLSQANKSELEVYSVFADTDILYKFGKEVLKKRLERKINFNLFQTRVIMPKIKEDRQLYNCKCILQGFYAVKEIINIDENTEREFYEYLEMIFANEYTVEKNFIELLQLVKDSGEYSGNFYVDDERGHYANFSPLYKAIAMEHEKTNSLLELLDMASLKKQLKECGFILSTKASKRFGTSEKNNIVSACVFKNCRTLVGTL